MNQSQKEHLIYALKDLTAGSFAGFCLCISGHPFDTIKVRIQVSGDKMFQVIKQTLKQEGVLAFYRGMEAPLVTIPIVNSVVFVSYEFYKRMMYLDENNKFSFQQGLEAGIFAGFMQSWILGPVELLKCRLQIQHSLNPEQSGPYKILKLVIQKEGLKGPLRGMFATQARDIFCYAGQFSSYEAVKAFMIKQNGGESQSISSVQSLIAGGIAGFSCWLVSYPQDVVKTLLQCELDLEKSKIKYPRSKYFFDGGFFSCAKLLYKEQGFMGFWRGFTACSIRAVYANAILYMAYENCKKFLAFDKNQN